MGREGGGRGEGRGKSCREEKQDFGFAWLFISSLVYSNFVLL